MSWTEELYKIYEYNCKREPEGGEKVMLPVFHSTANAQIEVTVDGKGNFKGADLVDSKDSETPAPVWECSISRQGTQEQPRALTDDLKYLASDFDGVDSKYHKAYMEGLKSWCDSEYSHLSVRAIYAYLEKSQIVNDLVKSGILKINEDTGKIDKKSKIGGSEPEKATVRFIVNDLSLDENRTWLDKSLYDCFVALSEHRYNNVQLCYALGKELPTAKDSPYLIKTGKLICENRTQKFAFAGRFSDYNEAVSVSYDFSQKALIALKWLIASKHAIRFGKKDAKAEENDKDEESGNSKTDTNMTIVVWSSALQNIPDIRNDCYYDENFGEDENIPDTMPEYKVHLKNWIMGYESKFEPTTKVMIMVLDSAAPGRLSISLYSELMGSDFFKNVQKWHEETAWIHYNNKFRKNVVSSFSVNDIINCAFGLEKDSPKNKSKSNKSEENKPAKVISCDSKLFSDVLLRLIPCITSGRRLPQDIVSNLCNRASNPLAYESYNHRKVLEVACGMIRKQYIDNEKGDISMSYDPNITDRSYLFGCLLAIADRIESDACFKDKKGDSEEGKKELKERSVKTNARRYWYAFSQQPYKTWGNIERNLNPYIIKLGGRYTYYEKLIQEIMNKMSFETFSDGGRLEPLYLLGYHHFTAKMFNDLVKSKKED